MSEYEQAVFISYAWNSESEEMVNQIERSLQERGIHIIRDKRDLGYKGLIGKFMERIGRGTCVIVVISDKYLRSPNCMFELVEIADGKEFHDRIFPLVLKDVDIYDPIKLIEYVRYWEVKRNELAEAIKTLDPANLQGIREDMDLYDRIRDRISGLASTLKDMNTFTPEVHRNSDFSELYAAIEKRLKESPPTPPDTSQEGLRPAIGATPVVQYFEPKTVLIPEGPFLMGSPQGSGAPANECPQDTVTLPAYRIGIYPVTNSQYEEFVREKHFPVAPVMGWDGQRVPAGLETNPVSGVTWYEALAYCEWLSEKTGRRYSLPNEAQWEKACRGVNGFVYPWGNDLEAGRSNHGCESIAAVDAYPAQNKLGCFDMVGNIRQWTCSLWGEKRSQPDARYRYPWKDDQRNSLSANRQIRRVVRGSSMRDGVPALRCSARSGQLPEDPGLPGLRHGFRVVMNLEER
ncbi:MAG TPA: SUMF1/EgtB/PvdO family nonheme iron enzyme [Anaerolineales bacterium]|nr:SUMF1/EgtB/PvdO family nonheme iron enzyme [Anaerolineales bacterium]